TTVVVHVERALRVREAEVAQPAEPQHLRRVLQRHLAHRRHRAQALGVELPRGVQHVPRRVGARGTVEAGLDGEDAVEALHDGTVTLSHSARSLMLFSRAARGSAPGWASSGTPRSSGRPSPDGPATPTWPAPPARRGSPAPNGSSAARSSPRGPTGTCRRAPGSR